MKQPEDVQLSREDGEALIERIEQNALSAEDRRVLVKVLTFYFWLLFALREAKLSLKRVKALVFGEKPKPPTSGGTPSGGSGGGSEPPTRASQAVPAPAPVSPPAPKSPPPGHGRQGADVYRAAQTVACRHEALAVGARCPACGRGSLYRLPPGVEMRLDGNALLSAVRYEVEKLRCSACGQIFPASVPAAAGTEKYTARARAVLALARYYLVATNLFLPLFRGCKRRSFLACCGDYRRRSLEHASLASSPALVNRHGPPAARGRLRAREPSRATVGRHLSVGGAGRRRGPEFCPARSDPDGPRPGVGRHAGLVSLGITQARTALFG